jgi:hypothetical protein
MENYCKIHTNIMLMYGVQIAVCYIDLNISRGIQIHSEGRTQLSAEFDKRNKRFWHVDNERQD